MTLQSPGAMHCVNAQVSRVVALVVVVLCVGTLTAGAQTQSRRGGSDFEGWTAIKEERYGDALEAFVTAARLEPRESTLRFGAGLAALMLGQTADARQWLEGALTLQPRFTEASLMLGEALYREGKVAQAADVYEAALQDSPEQRAVDAEARGMA